MSQPYSSDDGNSRIVTLTQGVGPFSSRRSYLTILNDSDEEDYWEGGVPQKYPPSWYSGSGYINNGTDTYHGAHPNQYLWEGLQPDTNTQNWEIPNNYREKYIDTYGGGFQGRLGLISYENQALRYGNWAVIQNTRAMSNSGPSIIMSAGDLRSQTWHDLCMQDESINFSGVGIPFELKNFIEIDESLTGADGEYGTGRWNAGFVGNTNSDFPQEHKNAKKVSKVYGRLCYSTIYSSYFLNGQHNPQDGITIQGVFKITYRRRFVSGWKLKRFFFVSSWVNSWEPLFTSANPDIPTFETIEVPVSYTFTTQDNPAVHPFGQRVHQTGPILLEEIRRFEKLRLDIPEGTWFTKVTSKQIDSIEYKTTSVSSKPFYLT